MGKRTKDYQLLSALIGLSFNKKSKTFYGQKEGFPVIVHDATVKKTNLFLVIVSARPTTEGLTINDVRQFIAENPFSTLEPKQSQVAMLIKSSQYPEELYQTIQKSINTLVSLLQSKRYEPCCASCGQNVGTSVYSISDAHLNDTYLSLCPACINSVKINMAYDRQKKHENVLGGIAGALLGSVIGATLILLLALLGWISVILGFVMAVCTFKGYVLLGKKMTKKGIVICTLIVLIMTYVSNGMDWAISAAVQLGVNVFTAFRAIPYLLKEGAIDSSVFINNLVMLYICTIIGVIVEVWAALNDGKIRKIGP